MNHHDLERPVGAASVPVIRSGPDGRIALSNAAANTLFGYDLCTAPGLSIDDLFPDVSVPDLAARIVPPATTIALDAATARRHDGRLLVVRMQVSAWTDARDGTHHTVVMEDPRATAVDGGPGRIEMELDSNAVEAARIGVFSYRPIEDSVEVSQDLARSFSR